MKGEGLVIIDGVPADSVDSMDRGLHYGDGVFRTLKIVAGQARWWRDHYAKLAEDCLALRIHCPADSLLKAEVDQVASAPGVGAVKILITRGIGPRGYRIRSTAEPTRIVMGFADHIRFSDAIQARWCDLRLSMQPRLAGIKHLNRLENVLARSEWDDPAIAEGLMRDASDHVICGTMSNLFIVERGMLMTPDLSQSGVAGVTRSRLMQAARKHGQLVQTDAISPERVLAAEQVLLCNSLIEICRVEKLEDTTWPDMGWADKLINWINEDH